MNVTWQYAVVCANAAKTRLNEVGLDIFWNFLNYFKSRKRLLCQQCVMPTSAWRQCDASGQLTRFRSNLTCGAHMSLTQWLTRG